MPSRKFEKGGTLPSDLFKKELSKDAKVIWVLHRRQPQTFKELLNTAGVSRSHLYRILKLLLREKIVKELTGSEDLSRGLFALQDYEPEPMERAVENVVGSWLREFEGKPYARPLSLEELIIKCGESPENREVRDRVYRCALKYGWIPPEISKRLVEHSKTDLRKALEAWLKDLEGYGYAVDGHLEDLHVLGRLDLFHHEVRIFRMPLEKLSKLDIEELNLLRQHLEEGGQEVLSKWRQLCEDANEFLEHAKSLAEKIVERIKDEAGKLGLSLNREAREEIIFVNNCVPLIYRSLKGELILDPQKDVKVEPEGNNYLVKPGPLCATRNLEKAKRFADFIRRQITWRNGRSEMEKINRRREEVKERIREFRRLLQELISKIDDGFYLKGSCEKCMHLQRSS